jgi:hypothetical protein
MMVDWPQLPLMLCWEKTGFDRQLIMGQGRMRKLVCRECLIFRVETTLCIVFLGVNVTEGEMVYGSSPIHPIELSKRN